MREHIEAILRACCSDSPGDRFEKPFRVGEHVYACDGRIIVRTKMPVNVDLAAGPPKGVDVSSLPWAALSEPEADWPADIPALPDLDDVECSKCYGHRERMCDMGHWHKCDECEGSGKGPPSVRLPPVRVGIHWMSATNAALLRAIGVRARPLACDNQVEYAFAGDGFEGLVVGVRKNSESSNVAKMRLVRAVERDVAGPAASACV
jgi:hypothetical protein